VAKRVTNTISFVSANFVARETGYAMHGWEHGDRATNEAFRPLETYESRLDAVLGDVHALGFDAIDLWGAHLSSTWATDEHLAIARELLARHGLAVTTYAAWLDADTVERACEIALGLGTTIIGGGASGDVRGLVPILRERGVVLALENHPERSPAELFARIDAGGGTLATTVDTGWWATQGYSPERAIEELAEHVAHVHLKDVLAEGEPHETCRWGRGIVDVEECVRALQRIGYAGAIAVEHEPEQEDPSDDCRSMLSELRAWRG
jgi:L-ribulose-5-phosphate 3-epimerase